MTAQIQQSIDTEELAARASLGDMEALAPLFEHFHDPLMRYLRTRTQNNVTLAEDVSAATWERVAASIHGYRTMGAGFEAWLFTIARRCLAAHFRIMQRRPERLDGEMLAHDRSDLGETPEQMLQWKLEKHRIAAAVNDLPATQRQCVILRFVVGLSHAEVGKVMGKKENAVKQLQLRALRNLHKELGGITCASDYFETLGSLTMDVETGEAL